MTLEIAERLTILRREHGYSQEALAEKLGVSRQAVSKWERAESSPDTDNLIALAELYGVTLDALIHGAAPESAPEPVSAPEPEEDPLPEGSYFEHKARMQEKRRMSFPYPIFVTAAYLLLGFCFGL